MYRCQPGLLMRLICWWVCVFCLLEAGFCGWLAFEPSLTGEMRVCAGFGVALFGGLALALLWRLLFKGYKWLEYDDRRLVLHFSRLEELEARWDELGDVTVREDGRRLLFGYGEQQLLVTPMFEGWRDLREELKHRGLLRPELDPQELLDTLFGAADRNGPGFHFFGNWKNDRK